MRFGSQFLSGKNSTKCLLIFMLKKKKNKARTNQQPTLEALGKMGKLAGQKQEHFIVVLWQRTPGTVGTPPSVLSPLGPLGWSSIPSCSWDLQQQPVPHYGITSYNIKLFPFNILKINSFQIHYRFLQFQSKNKLDKHPSFAS